MFRDIMVKVHYIADDGLLKNHIVEMAPPEKVKKYLKPQLEEIFDAEGYIGMEIEVKDTESFNENIHS